MSNGNTDAKSDKSSMDGRIGITDRFALLNHLITRDANKYRIAEHHPFFKFSKDDISKFLKDPYHYERQLREAVRYMYGASSHFRRIIQYFVGLSDFAYVVSPFGFDPKHASIRSVNTKYRRVLNMMTAMNVKSQFPKILTVCLREDCFFGTLWVTGDNITIQQLPSDYCQITSIEGNVFNVTFDFGYFDGQRNWMLPYFPPEFALRYDEFKKDRINKRFQELSSPYSFAVKCNTDVADYAMPPFAGVLRNIYDLEDYQDMKKAKTALENYAMVTMTIPLDSDGNWGIDLGKAENFWRNLDAVLPEEVGSVLTPMELDKISFEKSNVGDTDTISEAEQNLFTTAGVSSLLFNNESASSNALLLSIKADQAITYGIVKSIEDVVNRYIQSTSDGKNFRVNFLDCSPFNRKELGDGYLKAAQYGFPTLSMYAATQGLNQAELDSMSFLESDVLGLHDMFVPLQGSSTLSASETSDEGGAPQKDIGELSDSGEQSREDSDDW